MSTHLESNDTPSSTGTPSELRATARTDIVATPHTPPTAASSQSFRVNQPAGLRRLPAASLLSDKVGWLLQRVAGWLSPAFVTNSLATARDVGQYAVLAGAALTLVYAIFAAIRNNSFALFITGVGCIAALAIAQFAATRFLDAADRAVANTPSRISSSGFLECVGLLALLAAAGILVGGIVTAIRVESSAALVPALFLTATLTYFGALALHPEVVNVELADASAGEEAIGLLSCFAKIELKLIPMFFLLLVVAGDLAILASFSQSGQAFVGMVGSVLQYTPLPADMAMGLTGSTVVLFGCLVPIIGYFLFLLQYLALDVLRAVLAVPAKLDALRR